MNVAIIPARDGSKRIKNKNIKPFFGKPIISYAINVAKESKIFDRIIVSTNSNEIKDIALQFGAEVPSLRPDNLSDDFTTTLDVISYEVKNLNLKSDDIVCCIYPTTPLLNPIAKSLKDLNVSKKSENESTKRLRCSCEKMSSMKISGKSRSRMSAFNNFFSKLLINITASFSFS